MWELLTGDEPYKDMHCASIIGMCHILAGLVLSKCFHLFHIEMIIDSINYYNLRKEISFAIYLQLCVLIR